MFDNLSANIKNLMIYGDCENKRKSHMVVHCESSLYCLHAVFRFESRLMDFNWPMNDIFRQAYPQQFFIILKLLKP